MRYSNLEQEDTILQKIKRSAYLIISISLLTHTFSLVYSLITFKRQSASFISIIVSALSCFFISSSHLTIYGVSVLGTLYISMIQPYYSSFQIFYIVALSGVIIFAFWKPIHSIGNIFHCLPGRIHASLVFGVVLIVLSRFFPLAIQNITAFFQLSKESALSNPFDILNHIFTDFNVLTLALTVIILGLMFLMRGKLQKVPLIGIMVLIGIIINIDHKFKSYSNICEMEGIQCMFFIVDSQNIKQPTLNELVQVIPSSIILAVVLIFEQFLYLEQFERRGKRYKNEGNLGEITTETKTLAVANFISGCLGGLPICINIFGTYQNFSFNKKYGFKGTKWVGVLQIPFSFLLYTIFGSLFFMIPMFVLFIIVATPVIYFIKNVINYHKKNLHVIIFIALISLITHPIIALIFACFFSIYELSELLGHTQAQMIIESKEERRSSRSIKRASVIGPEPQKSPNLKSTQLNQFMKRVIQIEEDVPPEYQNVDHLLYRFIGTVCYMNFFQHLYEINKLVQSKCKPNQLMLILSLRYSQTIDLQSLNELAIFTQFNRSEGLKIIFTGLNRRLIEKLQQITYFSSLLQQQEKCMYSVASH